MPLTTVMVRLQQMVHNTQGIELGRRVIFGSRYEITFSLYMDESMYLGVGVFAHNCCPDTFCSSSNSTSSYVCPWLAFKEAHALSEPNISVRVFQKRMQPPFEKKKDKAHALFLKCWVTLHIRAGESVCAWRASKLVPVASTGHGDLSFWVSGLIPKDFLHCSPWRKCLPTAVLSCAFNATIAVMKMGPAMRGLREK